MKKICFVFFAIISLFTMSIVNTGCAGACQRIKANGSLVGTTNGNWIVIKESGGVITDVYKLNNVFVQSEEGSDGWLFIDQNGNPTHIGGDMKAIRVENNSDMFSKYIEYHTEFETVTYQEKAKSIGLIK